MADNVPISSTTNEIFVNGVMTRLSTDELNFINEFEKDQYANASPGLVNIYGTSNNMSYYGPGGMAPSDMPFKHAMPIVENNKIVGYGWRTGNLPGTTGPGSGQSNRANITENTTKDAIRRAHLDPKDPDYITPREANFIIRCRHGIEKSDVTPIPDNKKPYELSGEQMKLLSIRRNLDPNGGDRYAHYGTANSNTGFNSDEMKDMTNTQNLARQSITAVNNWTNAIQADSERPLSEKRIFETFDDKGLPVYLIKDPKKDPSDPARWKPYYPNLGFIEGLAEKKRQKVLEEIDHNLSGSNTRKPNDKTQRQVGPTLNISNYSPYLKGTPIYKTIKTIAVKGLYPSILGSFVMVGLLGKYKKLTEKTLTAILHIIEYASVTLKTTKNLAGQYEDPDWKEWLDPLSSPVAPIGFFFIAEKISHALKTGGFTTAGRWLGPIVTGVIITLELVVYYKHVSEQNELREKANQNGWLPGPYINTKGQLKIPVKRDGNNYKIPIGVDQNNKPIYHSDPISGVINPSKQSKSSENTGLSYTDVDDNNISTAISMNDDNNSKIERDFLYISALTENSVSGITGYYSTNDFSPPEPYPEERRWPYGNRWIGDDQADPTRTKSPIGRLSEADPFGDWSNSEVVDFLNRGYDPLSEFYGYGNGNDYKIVTTSFPGRGGDFLEYNRAPTLSSPNILNGNNDYINGGNSAPTGDGSIRGFVPGGG